MVELELRDICDAVGGELADVDPGLRVREISTDSRKIQPGELYWALVGETFDGHDYCRAAVEKGGVAAVIQKDKLPGLEIPRVRVPDTLYALGELARTLRTRSRVRCIGITGSAGKTTTKEFVHGAVRRLLRARATEGNENNLVGLPKTILSMEASEDCLILEMGTDRPGEIRRLTEIAQPDVGIVTTIGEAHLERLGGIEGVLEEKSDLLRGLPEDGTAVVPRDSPFHAELVAAASSDVVTFGMEKGADYLIVDPTITTSGCYGFLLETPAGKGRVTLASPGIHAVYAATAAAAAAVSIGLPLDGVIEGLQTYSGLPGRCQLIELNQQITVIADHYNANPVSMNSALVLMQTFLDRRRVFVAGEMWDLGRKSADLHEVVGSQLGAGGLDLLIAVGPRTRKLIHGARKAGMPSRSIKWFENTETAAAEIPRMLNPSDVVLVKGSRGMKMEGVVDSLVRHFGEKPS